jgi:hypothetical protein
MVTCFAAHQGLEVKLKMTGLGWITCSPTSGTGADRLRLKRGEPRATVAGEEEERLAAVDAKSHRTRD